MKFDVHTINVKDLISKFKSYQQYRVYNNPNNLAEKETGIRFPGGVVILYALVLDIIHAVDEK